jgi:hypothetical protein
VNESGDLEISIGFTDILALYAKSEQDDIEASEIKEIIQSCE